MPNPQIKNLPIFKNINNEIIASEDQLAIEEPLEIQLLFGPANDRKRKSISVTMRTPGHDFDLAIGFLFTEGIIAHYQNIQKVAYAYSWNPDSNENIVVVVLQPTVAVDLDKIQRHFYTSSSCGVCGKSSIEAISVNDLPELIPDHPTFSAALLHQLPDTLRKQQAVFKSTGGLHAAALFDHQGHLLDLREDVGRHNAVDKLIGAGLQNENQDFSDKLLLVSGRTSFELVQKSLTVGLPILAAVGAPSSLAVEMAATHGMTLIGFLRNKRYNIYSGRERID